MLEISYFFDRDEMHRNVFYMFMFLWKEISLTSKVFYFKNTRVGCILFHNKLKNSETTTANPNLNLTLDQESPHTLHPTQTWSQFYPMFLRHCPSYRKLHRIFYGFHCKSITANVDWFESPFKILDIHVRFVFF